MQSKTQSLTEAVTNTTIGFVISYLSTFLIFPIVGFNSNPQTNLIITIYFTVISVLRGYVVRRWFNAPKAAPKPQSFYTPYCYHCEKQTLVMHAHGKNTCAMCGTVI